MGKTFLHGNGGGGSGGTLVVSAPVGVTVIATNETIGKMYRRTANAAGIATFKGLATGVWSLSISDGETTSTPVSVEVNADYEITLAFFAAEIVVTYPANSTCTCSDGTTTFTDTNSTDAEKIVTFTVPNKGTWTIKCYNGADYDSSEKKKSAEVEITAGGQSESAKLSYELHLFEAGVGLASGYKLKHIGYGSSKVNTTQITLNAADLSENSQTYISPAIDCSQYSRASFTANRTKIQDMYSSLDIGLAQTPPSDDKAPTFAVYARVNGKEETFSLDLSSINETLYFCMAANRNTAGYVTDILFE